MNKKTFCVDEEIKKRNREKVKRYRENHPIRERAHSLVGNYKKEDEKYNRGEGDLTAKWVMKNIMFKPCAHCGKEGWNVIGCNRLDNSKPHTKDNVEPCCQECNHKLATEYQKIILGKPIDKIDGTTGEVLASYQSIQEAARSNKNFHYSKIKSCADGGYFDKRRNKWVNSFQYKGYVFKYK